MLFISRLDHRCNVTHPGDETLRSDVIFHTIHFVVIADVLVPAHAGCTASIVAFLRHGRILLGEYAVFGFEAVVLVWLDENHVC